MPSHKSAGHLNIYVQEEQDGVKEAIFASMVCSL